MAPVKRFPSSIATRSSGLAPNAASSIIPAGIQVASSPTGSNNKREMVWASRNDAHHIDSTSRVIPAPVAAPLGLRLISSGGNYHDWLKDVQEMADFNLEYKEYCFKDFSQHESGASLTKDFLFGVLLQALLGHRTPLQQEFDYRIDQELAARQQIPLLFVEMINILNKCQEKIKGREAA
ncbi:hypothetical protein PTTG_00302 [Puccinia triticina 1-1 BBBD Race 1]|uniref:Uncharacterized protein n=1 Tax=Puccinia triticina (isolate 1-1 / race 1 (BBBD)) TaxID=630390 RepID=A0A0C4EHT6_PUCT1|nr:hypothetical protein PTTG_00302 [Puccinia triticina 1-1 BBBD Race 1]